MKSKIHAIAGVIALLTIASFWTSTLFSELFADHSTIAYIKQLILKGMFILIPSMMMVGASGFSLSQKMRGPVIEAKKKRMKIIAANGILILLPSAFFLAAKASSGEFDFMFYGVQALELIAGATNITLIILNIRAGRKLSRR